MNSELNGKHVLVTGASGGIGQAIAEQFDDEKSVLSLHYHTNEIGIHELQSKLKGKHSFFQADLSSESSTSNMFSKAIEENGRIDVLIVNHGIWPEKYTPTHEMPLEQWDKTIDINLRAAFICSKEFLNNLEEHSGDYGSIVYISSTAGLFGEAGHVDYSVSKSGLYGMMLSIKNEIVHLARFGRVNVVAPGWTISPMTQKFMSDHDGIRSALQTMPLRKLARTRDIASMVVFLSSDKLSGHISGQLITVAGGMEGRKLFDPEEINISRI
ncbi:MAG: SDR family NAD(P)-dependent oxidoreductase [Candidatus Hermodarchaeota archaeon]